MELLVEILVEFVIEVVVGAGFELLIHWLGWYLEGARHLDIRKWVYPVLFSAAGFACGLLTSLVWPAELLSNPYFAIVYIFIVPAFPALVLPLLRLWRRRRGLQDLEVDRFLNGYLMLLMFFVARILTELWRSGM